MSNRYYAERPARTALLGTVGSAAAAASTLLGCSLQDFGHLRDTDALDGGLGGSINVGGWGGTGNGGTGGAAGAGGSGGDGGSMGIAGASGGNSGAGGTPGGSGGSAGGDGSGGVGGSESCLETCELPDGGAPFNLIADPGFEQGIADWVPWGDNQLLIHHGGGAAAGDYCLRSTGRNNYWKGPSYFLENVVTPGQGYEISAWVRVGTDTTRRVYVTTKTLCPPGSESQFNQAGSIDGTNNWQRITGQFVAPACEGLLEFRVIFEGPTNEDIYVDEVRVAPIGP